MKSQQHLLSSEDEKPEIEQIIKTSILPEEAESLNADSRDLLMRLLEINPKFRIKSLLGLGRIAFFKGFNFEDVKHKKVGGFLILVLLGFYGGFFQISPRTYFTSLDETEPAILLDSEWDDFDGTLID